MRVLFFGLLLLAVFRLPAQNNSNSTCSSALPFCSVTPVTFPAGTGNTNAQPGPNYGCLGGTYNPAWFYFRIAQGGPITITISSNPAKDIDFICWGPFSSSDACGMLTGDKIVDCSYSASSMEICEIPYAAQDQYYFMMLTNFSNQPCNITFQQTSGTGQTDCTLTQPASNNGPLCVGDTLHLSVGSPSDAFYSWTGPAGFTSTLQNPTINNVSAANAGWYFVAVTVGKSTVAYDSTMVEIYAPPAPAVATNNSPVCGGGLLTLSSSFVANAGYHWTGPNGFESTLQNPTVSNSATGSMAGTYTLTTVNLNCNCPSSPSYTNVVVNETPSPVATSNSPICEGSMLSLSASTIPGAIYQWTGPNGFSSSLQNPVVSSQATVSMSGQYSVIAVLNSCVSVASTVNVVVNPTPAAPAAGYNSPVCEEYSLSLAASTIAGANYSWSGPNGYSSTLQNPLVTSNAAISDSGVYSVVATVSGCSGPTGSVHVDILDRPEPPVASNNGPVCEGNMLMLNASSVTNASYIWAGPNNFISSEQNPVVSQNALPVQSGTYEVQAISTSNGCYSEVSATVAIVNHAPEQPVISQTYHTLHSTPAYSYQWYLGAELIPGAISQDYDPGSVGSYKVKAIDNNGCEKFSEAFWFDFVGEIYTQNGPVFFKVYPNPSLGEVNFVLPDEALVLILVDSYGQKILEKDVRSAKEISFEIPVAGVYLSRVYTKKGISSAVFRVL